MELRQVDMGITYVIPTRNRHHQLCQTLEALSRLHHDSKEAFDGCGAEILVVDNASDPPVELSSVSSPILSPRVIRLHENHGAAARNLGVKQAQYDWIVMLDDDSYPLDGEFVVAIQSSPADVAVVGAEISLSNGRREAGGLPEVFIGCGAAIRREAFLAVDGYDSDFGYYAEEYDLSAKLILAGWRIIHDRRFKVRHQKVAAGRDMGRILQRLVRNNGWVAWRYAPDDPDTLTAALAEAVSRYAFIAVKEGAAEGFALGMSELLRSLDRQPRHPMTREQFDRFTGLAHARKSLESCSDRWLGRHIAIVDEGKNSWVVRQVVEDLGAVIVDEPAAEWLVVGTLSPGPMLDSWEMHRAGPRPVFSPWQLEDGQPPGMA